MKFLRSTILILAFLIPACSSPIEPDPPLVDAMVAVDAPTPADASLIDAIVLVDAAIPCSEYIDLSSGPFSPDWTVTANSATTSTPSAALSIPIVIQDDMTWLAANFSGVTGAGMVSVTLMNNANTVVEILADGDHIHSIPVDPPHTILGPHMLVIETSTSLVEVTVSDVVVGYTCTLFP